VLLDIVVERIPMIVHANASRASGIGHHFNNTIGIAALCLYRETVLVRAHPVAAGRLAMRDTKVAFGALPHPIEFNHTSLLITLIGHMLMRSCRIKEKDHSQGRDHNTKNWQ
jgi:hypothetical protein